MSVKMRIGNVITSWLLFASAVAAADDTLHGKDTSFLYMDNTGCESNNASLNRAGLTSRKTVAGTEYGKGYWEGLASRKLVADGEDGESLWAGEGEGGGGSIHSGEKFQDVFYENECYKVDKYPKNVCIKWVDSILYMVAKHEYDIYRQGAMVLKWTNQQVHELLQWNVGMMTWDGNNAQHPTRLLDASNIRVLDSPGYYYIQKVVVVNPSIFPFSQPFANFALSQGGFNNPPFTLCSHGNSPHVQAQSTVPMCCRNSIDSADKWYCSHPLEDGKNYYPNNCIFDINDCSDPLQDCNSRQQFCINLITAKDDDHCENMSDDCYYEGKWMFSGSEFSRANQDFVQLPNDGTITLPQIELPFQKAQRKNHTFKGGLESGNYRFILRLSTPQFNRWNLDPETQVGYFAFRGLTGFHPLFSRLIFWKEWTEDIMYFEYNFVIDSSKGLENGETYFYMRNYQKDFPLFFDFVRLDKTENTPTLAPTQNLWQQVDGPCTSITVDDLGNVNCVGRGNLLYKRALDSAWSVVGNHKYRKIWGSSDGILFGIYLPNDRIAKVTLSPFRFKYLADSGTLFDELSISDGGSHLYAVNADTRDVYYRDGFSGAWQSISGDLDSVTVSGDGNHLWGYQTSRKINNVLYRGNGGSWVRVSGPCQFLSLAVTREGNHIWGVCPEDGELYHREGSDGEWQLEFVPGTASQVTVSGNGQHVWVLDNNSIPFYKAESLFIEPYNVALGKPTEQSSTCYGGISARAVDGDIGGVFDKNSVTHTCSNSMNWWSVDLGDVGPSIITKIVIWNRNDGDCYERIGTCWGDRLNGAKLEIFNGKNLVASQEVGSNKNSYNFEFEKLHGDVVMISLEDEFLSLAEVEVFGFAL